jgi:hypothetical protein
MNKVLYNQKTLVNRNGGLYRFKPVSYTRRYCICDPYDIPGPGTGIMIGSSGENLIDEYINDVIDKFIYPYQLNDIATAEENFDNGSYDALLLALNPFYNDSVCAELALRAMAVVQRGILQNAEIDALQSTVDALQQQLNSLYAPRVASDITTELSADVSLDIRYLLYIQEYGPPKDGIFDPVLLSNCMVQ